MNEAVEKLTKRTERLEHLVEMLMNIAMPPVVVTEQDGKVTSIVTIHGREFTHVSVPEEEPQKLFLSEHPFWPRDGAPFVVGGDS